MDLKRYITLLTATAVAVAAILLGKEIAIGRIAAVSVYTMTYQSIDQVVSCNGKVESAVSKNVYLDADCVPQNVLVRSGQSVQKGDVLFTVDVEATKAVMANGGEKASQTPAGSIQKEVTAPVSGVIAAVNIREGEMAAAKNPCIVLFSNQDLQFRISIPESQLKGVSVGQPVLISGSAFHKKQYKGVLEDISSIANPATGPYGATVDAVVFLKQGEWDESIRIGLSAKADIVVRHVPNGLIVPYEYVMQDENGQEYVYVVEGRKARKRVIVTGAELSNGFHVLEGLVAGDQVIQNPHNVDKDGQFVRLKD